MWERSIISWGSCSILLKVLDATEVAVLQKDKKRQKKSGCQKKLGGWKSFTRIHLIGGHMGARVSESNKQYEYHLLKHLPGMNLNFYENYIYLEWRKNIAWIEGIECFGFPIALTVIGDHFGRQQQFIHPGIARMSCVCSTTCFSFSLTVIYYF